MEATAQGLYVTAVGMTLLFLAMGLIMLCMALLARAFPVREGDAAAGAGALVGQSNGTAEGGDEGARIAALAAVALALSERARSALIPTPTAGRDSPGPWVVIGRQAIMQSRKRG